MTASYSGGGRYEASEGEASLVVTPAVLTLTADNQQIKFGDPLPSFTFTETGFVNGDSTAVVSGSPQLSTTATSNSPVGAYPIIVSTGTLAAANYTFAFVSGTLTISQATPQLTLSCPANVIHNGHRHGCTATATGVGGAAVKGSLVVTYNGSLRPPKKVGTYNVVATFTSADTNYTNATATASLVIQPRHHHDRDDDRDDDDE